MLDAWTDLLKKLPSVHTVVHVGAGRGANFPTYLQLKAKKVILIEPQTELARQLDSASVPYDLTVINRAVDSEARLRTFYQANNSYFSGFTNPRELQPYFPDLRLESEFTMDTWPLADCIDEHVSTRGNNLLILDVPDMSVELLVSLEQRTLKMFRWVVGPYLVNNESDRSFTKHCKDSDFWSLTFPGQPPHAFLFAERNPLAGALAKAEDRLRSLEQAQASLTAEVNTLGNERSALQAENAALQRESKAQQNAAEQLRHTLEEVRQRSAAEQKQQSSEIERLRGDLSALQAQNTALKTEVELQQSAAQQLQTELTALRDEDLARSTREQERLAKEIESLGKELAAARADNEALESEADGLRSAAESLQKEAAEHRMAQDELSHRQRLLDDEVLKAEAQLTLIKEVLIRDKI